MKMLVRIALIAMSIALAGCSKEPTARLMAANNAVTVSREVISASVARQFASAQARVAPDEEGNVLSYRFFDTLRWRFSDTVGQPEVTDWSTESFLGNNDPRAQWVGDRRYGTKAHLTLRYRTSQDDALYARFDLIKRGDLYKVTRIGFWRVPGEYIDANNFDTAKKPVKQTLVLFCVLAMLCFVVATSIACLATRAVPHKVAWLALIWVGFIQATLNWSTGEFALSPFMISLPPVWISQQNAWEPLLVQFLVPVGAIYYWFARPWLKRTE